MANAYVTINLKQYSVRFTRYEPTEEKAQAVHVTVGGTHVSQHFNFIEYRWAKIRLDQEAARAPERGQ